MYNVGDLIVYSGHGICQVDSICDREIAGKTKKYYVLHPIDKSQKLTINTPVDNDQTVISKLMNKEEAEKILESFKQDGIEWIDRPQLRSKVYREAVDSGNREEIANVLNTLLRKKHEIELEDKKFYAQDQKLVDAIDTILFEEMAIALNTSYESIKKMVYHYLNIA